MADTEGHVWPSEQKESDEAMFKALRRQRTNKCFIYIFVLIMILYTALVVLALLVLRVKSPQIRLRSVTVGNLDYTVRPPSFNTTLSGQVSVKNRNFRDYEFEPSTMWFMYGGGIVGSSRLGKGKAKLKKTVTMSFGVDLRSGRLPDSSNNLASDIDSGMLKLSVSSEVNGKMALWKLVMRKRGKIDCTMTLILKEKMIRNLVCK